MSRRPFGTQGKGVREDRAPERIHAEENVNEGEQEKEQTILFVISDEPYAGKSSNNGAHHPGVDRNVDDRAGDGRRNTNDIGSDLAIAGPGVRHLFPVQEPSGPSRDGHLARYFVGQKSKDAFVQAIRLILLTGESGSLSTPATPAGN